MPSYDLSRNDLCRNDFSLERPLWRRKDLYLPPLQEIRFESCQFVYESRDLLMFPVCCVGDPHVCYVLAHLVADGYFVVQVQTRISRSICLTSTSQNWFVNSVVVIVFAR